MDNLTDLVDRINNMYEDIRAEVIVSDLLEAGVRTEDIVIRFIGQLHRPRSRDISDVQIAKNNHLRKQLELILNRDSIYDTLPEGLFHQPSGNEPGLSVSAMVDEYRLKQQEEKEARQFFAPFENELFLQKTFTESEEFGKLFQLQQARLNTSVLKKIGIDPTLPQKFTSKLLRMLPYNDQIAGNISRTEQVFNLLLGDPVRMVIDTFKTSEVCDYCSLLGQSTLGTDLVTGDTVVPDHNLFILNIGPIPKKGLLFYEEEKWKAKALHTLIDFFIPVEWDLNWQVFINQDDAKSFLLNNTECDARLGYTTFLHA